MSSGTYSGLLKSLGFQSFLWTQFLGALNDNIFKMVISLYTLNLAAQMGGESGSISLIGAVFILPFLLFSGYAGNLADLYDKRIVLIATKSMEIVSMALGVCAFYLQRMDFMLAVLFLMALQSTLFSPAKYGILPEMLPDKELSRANGLLEMSTFLAIILGTSISGYLYDQWGQTLWAIGLLATAIAIVGTLASFGISRVNAGKAQHVFNINPWSEVWIGIKRMRQRKPLWLAVIGITYFWFLGALFQLDMLLLGQKITNGDNAQTSLLFTFLAVGIGAGSLAAGRLSGDKVELGLVPIGSIGMGAFCLIMGVSAQSYAAVAALLMLVGFCSGLFIVPLYAYVQQKCEADEKGRIIGASNFINTAGILLASAALWICSSIFHLSPEGIILLFGFVTLGGTIYILWLLPDFLIRFLLWSATHMLYKIRIIGQENVPLRGPALLVCNHLSYVDGLIVGACIQRFIRFMVHRSIYDIKAFRWFFRLMNFIPVSGDNRKDIVESIKRAREELRNGHIVCIFAEGAISRTGHLMSFKRGMEKIVEGLDVPIVPVHLAQLWGSMFSYKAGRFIWKWPQCIPYPITVSFGKPLPASASAQETRQAVLELGADAAECRKTKRDLLHLRFIHTAKRRWRAFCMADSSGQEWTYGRTLIGAMTLARWIRRQYPAEAMIGLMLPASAAGALANIAVHLAGKVAVNLNFTVGRSVLLSSIEQTGMRCVITSRQLLERAHIEPTDKMIFLEDIMEQLTRTDKAVCALAAYLLPSRALQYFYSPKTKDPGALAAILFSSGSTGTPKGIMLSHYNIVSNLEGFSQIFALKKNDKLMGVLPFFHAFGLTGTLWYPILSGFGAVYHPNPLDAGAIGKLVEKHRCAVIISTPAFYQAYIRKVPPEQFSSLRYAVAGAEKLRLTTAEAFKEKFGVDLLEGYGCTEMGPSIAVNIPDAEDGTIRQTGYKPGTVGHPIPGVAVKIVDPETGEILPYNQEGLLLAKSPGRMLGYFRQPEKTQEVSRDGWYVTGDIAAMDEEGFLRITDRLSRFSKIGGEMVPHLKIEEAVNQFLGEERCVVTAIPDNEKGERLVVLHTNKKIDAPSLWQWLTQVDLPKIWIPKRENIFFVESIPTLGSGKIDLTRINLLAKEMTANA
ncbi:MAG: acyl-[ACP]--phospholipid O-acyltransferase [Candidatus Omnitrophota bacterium]